MNARDYELLRLSHGRLLSAEVKISNISLGVLTKIGFLSKDLYSINEKSKGAGIW